jgi:hypothetical protein
VGESLVGNQKALSPLLFLRYPTLHYPKCQELFHSKLGFFIRTYPKTPVIGVSIAINGILEVWDDMKSTGQNQI